MTQPKLVGERLEEILISFGNSHKYEWDSPEENLVLGKSAILALFKSIMPEEKRLDGENKADDDLDYGWNSYRTELLKRLEEK